MLYTKRSHIQFGTARANTFFLNNLFKDSRGTVRAFEINQLKRSLFQIRYSSRVRLFERENGEF